MSKTNSSKKCYKCKNIKLLSEFHKHGSKKDGLRSDCKVCALAANAAYKKTDAGRLSQAKYAKTGAGKLSHAKYQAKYRKTDAGKLSLSNRVAKYNAVNPAKIKAKDLLNTAVKFGRMTRSSVCEECSSTKRIHGHHDDYSLPLVVRWLCQICHITWHTENGPGLNG